MTDGFGGASELLEAAATIGAIACLATLLTRVRVRIRRPRVLPCPDSPRNWFLVLVSTIGISLLGSSPAAALGHLPVSPRRSKTPAAAPPWSPTGGSPPRPSVGSGAFLPPWKSLPPTRTPDPAPDPASRGAGLSGIAERNDEEVARKNGSRKEMDVLDQTRFYPRGATASEGDGVGAESCSERDACMAAHPSGRPIRHTVKAGECLWVIAESVLGTEDPVRVARYWAHIHRLNRDVIGPDPDRIYPGQVLQLPPTERSA